MKYIPYGRQSITKEDIQAVIEVLGSDLITQGPVIRRFEEELAKKSGAKYAVTLNSGTSALHAAYFAAGLRNGDEFITSPNTFAATANAGLYLGAKPVFVDIEPETGNIDTGLIEEKITEKTKLVVPVHFSGHPANMEKISHIAKNNNLVIIEDACHALGAGYEDTITGDCRLSDMAVLSFHPVKHITTGEGGAVLTNDREYYKKLLMFRNHGITKEDMYNQDEGDWYYEMHYLGHNYRITDFQAALGLSQLAGLDNNINRRREIADIYKSKLDGNQFFYLPPEKEYARSAFHLYPIRLKEHLVKYKKDIFSRLRESKLGVQTHYIPVYMHPYYRNNGYKDVCCENAEKYYRSEISIPMYHSMTNSDLLEVIDRLVSVFSKYK